MENYYKPKTYEERLISAKQDADDCEKEWQKALLKSDELQNWLDKIEQEQPRGFNPIDAFEQIKYYLKVLDLPKTDLATKLKEKLNKNSLEPEDWDNEENLNFLISYLEHEVDNMIVLIKEIKEKRKVSGLKIEQVYRMLNLQFKLKLNKNDDWRSVVNDKVNRTQWQWLGHELDLINLM